ncbi:MAG: Holliday junction resolvase YqgF, partial [Firmicutes bacterium]|nr:Holliday junction resolvase YqgF [Bacillota bacterium]
MDEVVIAVDPGRQKCGIAVAKRDSVLIKQVVETAGLAEVISEFADRFAVKTIVVGDRTSHNAAIKIIKSAVGDGRKLNIELIDEHRSTDEARGRYWLDNPPRGLARLWPVTMRVPPVPVDNYVA